MTAKKSTKKIFILLNTDSGEYDVFSTKEDLENTVRDIIEAGFDGQLFYVEANSAQEIVVDKPTYTPVDLDDEYSGLY